MNEAFHRAESGGIVLTNPDVPLTLAQTEALLEHLTNELEVANDAAKEARIKLAEAQVAHKKAENRLLLSEECPKVGRGLGMVTAAERDAWVFMKAIAEWEAVHFAEVHLANATSYAWKLREQNSLAQSLNNNAKAVYGGGGR
ncbi:hypothetical protein [Nonomuraea sp. NPDC003804]|uniref:hypothetical protein n=1 Tax=Nonomuraea sp. NPDC003804 TaxID=3154547 RepID=UPI0033BB9764